MIFAALTKYKLILVIGAFVVSNVASFGAGYWQRGLVETQRQVKLIKSYNESLNNELRKNNVLSQQLEDALKNQKEVVRVVREYVTKEIEKPVYRDCVVPSSGVSAINETARNLNGTR